MMNLWFGGGGGAKSSPSSTSGEKTKGGLRILDGAWRKQKSKNLEREEQLRKFNLDSFNEGSSTRSAGSPITPYPLPSVPSPSSSSSSQMGPAAPRTASCPTLPVHSPMIGASNAEEEDFDFQLGSTSGSGSTSSAGSQESSLSAPPRDPFLQSFMVTPGADPNGRAVADLSGSAIATLNGSRKATGAPLSPRYGKQRQEHSQDNTCESQCLPSPLRASGPHGGPIIPRNASIGPLENSIRSPRGAGFRREEPLGTSYYAQKHPDTLPVHSPRKSPGPTPKIPSMAASPLHPKVGVQDCTNLFQDKEFHRLPLPPGALNGSPLPLSPTSSPYTSIPRSPERPTNVQSRWRKGSPLGSGTFGQVYTGFHSENGQSCAIKEVLIIPDNESSVESAKQLMQEISLLSQMKHANIVQYYGSEMFEDRLFIYLEFMSNGSIHNIIQQYGPLSESCIRAYTRQILLGLSYLHGKNTVHRDIKGANILVDKGGEVKLADFGMAKHITEQSFLLSFKGSPYWMAPEVIQNKNGYDSAVDIWSLGCTVLEMATGKPPWSEFEGIAAVFKIGNSREVPSIPDFLSEDAKMFLRYCLQREPRARPTAAQLLEHPFVRLVERSNSNVLSEALQRSTLRSPMSPRSPRRNDPQPHLIQFGSEPGQFQQSSPRHQNFTVWDGMPLVQDGVIGESHPIGFGTEPSHIQHTPESSSRHRNVSLRDGSAPIQHTPESSPRHRNLPLRDGLAPAYVPVDGMILGESRTMRSPRRYR